MPYITGASCLSEDGVLLKRWTLRPSVVAHSGDLLLVCKGAGYGKTAFCDIPEAHIARQIMAMHSGKLLDLRYLRVHLIANIQSIKRFGQGLIPGIDRNTVLSILVPIPPFAEQKRIVAKIEELFSEADKIATAEDGIARTAERINKKILDLAIRGQLVPQDPNDEPTDKLLERLRVSRTGLTGFTGLKSDTPNPVNPVNPVEITHAPKRSRTSAKSESVIFRAADRSAYETRNGKTVCIDDEIPFEIPDSWAWTRLSQVVELISGRDLEPTEYNDQEEGLPYITGASCLSENGVLLKRWTPRPSVVACSGDLLLVCKGAGYGKTAFCDIPEAHIARQIMAMRSCKLLDLRYLRGFLIANIQSIKRFGQGLIPGIDRNTVLSMLIPLPPLAEQKRIVAKIEEVRKLMQMLTR